MSISRHQAVGAYRRWEPPSLDDPGQAQVHVTPAEPEPLPPPEPPAASLPEPAPEPTIQLPTAADIEAMYEDARREGYTAGFAEGAELARQQAERLADLANDLDESLKRLDQDVAEEVVALAVEIARQMVRHTLADHPSTINDTVRTALHQLPQSQVRIHVHPDDMALVREFLAEQSVHVHHQLLEDDSVTRGGCRLHTPSGEIDATLETRWRRILEGLGRGDTAWEEKA
ncbi:flagellar assembly protein FliH [Aromatoleum diolicum]|uniref:Flagellar assembly protein FliH n=1 Tax=Aromatoleum diolicum TaxID=75796 RepID=A0ABX1QH82_9RHOO|nr:flagellar assembly protein FliH [Aromatoleum diolicum]NMG76405.1 flagellar assembly protein FliH [Aromatoleum diolicum]